MQLFVTVREQSPEAAVRAIRAIDADHDGVEVRVEEINDVDFATVRAATTRPIIATWRGQLVSGATIERALAAGIDFVDVEYREGFDQEAVARHRDRVVLSHHDFEGMDRVEEIAAEMTALGCAHVKIAVTPQDFASNLRLLRLAAPGRSLIGMGERGLYTRILAPFRGSALTFVAAGRAAAPSQLTLTNALAIYGPQRAGLHAERVFGVVGNPAGHSLSPTIHNGLFREKGVSAAYTIASVASFAEIQDAFLRGEPCGLSVTAPFKEEAIGFAKRFGAEIGPNAIEANAVNTLVKVGGRIIADNTDVDGFEMLLTRAGEVRRAAIAGAGSTARAAAVALERAGIATTTFNRTAERADQPLDKLASFDGELVIDTLPSGAIAPLPSKHGLRVIRAAYGDDTLPVSGDVSYIDGLELLHAQAVRQHRLFMHVFEG